MSIKDKIIEIDKQAARFIELKKLANNASSNIEFIKFKQSFFQDLKSYIELFTAKYKRFSNYEDLNQDGYVAALQALESYKIDKGSLAYWLKLYIETKTGRQANNHSAFHIPLKHIVNCKPIKVDDVPVQYNSKNPESDFQKKEILNQIAKTISFFPEKEREIMNYYFGNCKISDEEICLKWNINKKQMDRIMRKCLKKIKNKYYDYK